MGLPRYGSRRMNAARATMLNSGCCATVEIMNDPGGARVAVYIDFDNIVISRYDQVHGRGQFQRDKSRGLDRSGPDGQADQEMAEKLRRATVDIGAVLDFASSFGTLV